MVKFMRYVRGSTNGDKIRSETIRSDLSSLSINDKEEENKTK